MKKSYKNILAAAAFALMWLPMTSSPAWSQDFIEIEPLFEYPVAPEEIPSLEEKSNFLVEHFWDSMDFKTKKTVDQNALNDAFKVYSAPLRFASRDKAILSADKLIENISKNPTLLLQFTKAAEENLYGPRANAWIDDIYIKFLNAVVKNKKVPEKRKEKSEKQLKILHACKPGETAPTFDFTDKQGNKASYFPMSTPTVIIFGDPRQTDWRMARLRLETNTALSQAVAKGKINILYIIPSQIDGWQNEVSNYPSTWIVGCADDLSQKIDIRIIPSVYLIGSDGKLILKNTTVDSAVRQALQLVADQN